MANNIMTKMEQYILQNQSFDRLPQQVRQILGNSEKQYEKLVVEYSLSHQLRWKKNLVRKYVKDGLQYYTELLKYSREHLMMYPYHLADIFVDELNTTTFAYYHLILCDMINAEKSYDSLPNFSAGDCLHCLGIGRNQYIELMNTSKSKGGLFYKSRKDPRLLLPDKPRAITNLAYWWTVSKGYVTEEDIKACSVEEHDVIDRLYDRGTTLVGVLDKNIVESLYMKNLVYFNVPIADEDMIYVPPLEGFVMNRVLGDYFENLLYKIFVTIDAHTTVKELAVLLRQDLQLVKDAVSAYCRLGFAFKRGTEALPLDGDWHETWRDAYLKEQMVIPVVAPPVDPVKPQQTATDALLNTLTDADRRPGKRVAFLFDSTLTAFLMMGNLSPGLKKHAVTMFEAGKLSDEALDEFLAELDGSNFLHEGEAQAYFEHAMTLRDTVRFLRWNQDLEIGDAPSTGLGLDLIRCESINSLDAATCARVLQKNYTALISMSPLARETRSLISCNPPHIGPSLPEVESMWFKLWLYSKVGEGPPSFLFVAGTRVQRIPKVLLRYGNVLITSSSNETNVVSITCLLVTLNDVLSRSPVLVQGYGMTKDPEIAHLPFPVPESFLRSLGLSIPASPQRLFTPPTSPPRTILTSTPVRVASGNEDPMWNKGKDFVDDDTMEPDGNVSPPRKGSDGAGRGGANPLMEDRQRVLGQEEAASSHIHDPWTAEHFELCSMSPVRRVFKALRLQESCGFITLVKYSQPPGDSVPCADGTGKTTGEWVLFDVSFGIPLFDARVNRCILEQILARQLFSATNLRKLMKSHREEALELLHFISVNQELPLAFDPRHPAKNYSPTPTHNIESSAGMLSCYIGE